MLSLRKHVCSSCTKLLVSYAEGIKSQEEGSSFTTSSEGLAALRSMHPSCAKAVMQKWSTTSKSIGLFSQSHSVSSLKKQQKESFDPRTKIGLSSGKTYESSLTDSTSGVFAGAGGSTEDLASIGARLIDSAIADIYAAKHKTYKATFLSDGAT